MLRPLLLLPPMLCATLLAGCTGDSPDSPSPGVNAPANDPPIVVVTIEANRYLAARLAGDLATVTMPVPADADPLLWEPGRDAIAEIQRADRVILNGAGLETWLSRVSLAPSRTVTLAGRYRGQWLTFEGTVEHQHGPGGAHTHTGVDPHVWFDPQLLKVHVDAIAQTLTELFPDHSSAIARRAAELHADLEALDAAFDAIDGLPPLLANHPAYDYAARRYDWDIENHDLDPEAVPDAETIAALAATERRVMLWESAPVPEAEAALAAVGIRSVVVPPCEHPPESGDWLAVMRENVRTIAAVAR